MFLKKGEKKNETLAHHHIWKKKKSSEYIFLFYICVTGYFNMCVSTIYTSISRQRFLL